MIESLLSIPILFFVFGIVATFLKSNLEVSKGLIDSITLYLMLAIGIKGGISIAAEPITLAFFEPILIVVLGSILVARYIFFVSKRIVDRDTAAAIAATYGSNSTMTFITAAAFLTAIDISYGGYMTVALVLMETPAIIYGIFLSQENGKDTKEIFNSLKRALTDGTHLLLIASLVIGAITVFITSNQDLLYGFVGGDIFTGALCFFLLSMGLKVGKSFKENLERKFDSRLFAIAVLFPWINGSVGYLTGTLLGLASGDLFLVTMLMASASYIVAPAIIEKAIPRADVSKYLTMSLAITFPMNILLGIPLWWFLIG